MSYKKSISLLCSLFLTLVGFSSADIDKTKYIPLDEIQPGMDAHCLTVYQGVEPVKYNLKVVAVVKNIAPNRNAILVMGTDQDFIHTGPVAGCSGSPVYINGRLAGALAFGWSFSKDPLYGVTPIDEMLAVGNSRYEANSSYSSAIDFTKPVDLKASYQNILDSKSISSQPLGISPLACPVTTNLPQSSFNDFLDVFEYSGLMPVAGGSTSGQAEYPDLTMKPGGILALPLVYGDIDLSAIGTITEVIDNKVYAFGHSLLGQGPVELPMATGSVHAVVANLVRSFKYGQSLDIKGSLYADEATAVVGTIGKKAPAIPMSIKVERFNDEKIRTYNAHIAVHNNLTPALLSTCLSGTATMLGDLPKENSVKYKTQIGIKGYDPVIIENFSSGDDLRSYISDSIGAVNLVMNNPYDRPEITSLDFEIKILPQNLVSHIWSFEVSQTSVKPGDIINAKITIEEYLSSSLKTYKTEIKIPVDTKPGDYILTAGGADSYKMFLSQFAPFKFMPENMPGLVKVINQIANIKRNSLYVTLALPASGIAIENSQLPQLPVTKSLLLKNDKRAMTVMPQIDWIEKTMPLDTLVLDSKDIRLTVEEL